MTRIDCVPVTFGGYTKRPGKYWNFKEAIKNAFKGQTSPLYEKLKIIIELYIEEQRVRPNRNDLDNFLKPIIDSLDDAKYIEEWKISSISIKRIKVNPPTSEGVDIRVEPDE